MLFVGSASAFPLLVLAAILSMYIVLGILYESLIHPITILSTLPSAGVGALLSLAIFDIELDVISGIGVILLIGLVKKNAIMLVDFAINAKRSPRRQLARRNLRGLPVAPAPDPDDDLRRHARRHAAGFVFRRGRRDAPSARRRRSSAA